MKIPDETLKKWRSLQAYGDISKMADGDTNKRVYLSNALSKGECSEDLFITLRDFYNKREQLLETVNHG